MAPTTLGNGRSKHLRILALLALGSFVATSAFHTSCVDQAGRADAIAASSSCMRCHNGSGQNDYAGPGIENPHPFPGADQLSCTQCHGGNKDGIGAAESTV